MWTLIPISQNYCINLMRGIKKCFKIQNQILANNLLPPKYKDFIIKFLQIDSATDHIVGYLLTCLYVAQWI